MAEGRKYYIYVSGTLIEVSRDVYYAYHQEDRHARAVEEKDQRNGLVKYSSQDTAELSGEEMLLDREAVSVEDAAIASVLRKELHRCLALLPKEEQELIHALYFVGLSERDYATHSGLSQTGINKQKQRILCKLRKMIKT